MDDFKKSLRFIGIAFSLGVIATVFVVFIIGGELRTLQLGPFGFDLPFGMSFGTDQSSPNQEPQSTQPGQSSPGGSSKPEVTTQNVTPAPTPTPTPVKITGDICVDGFCLEATNWDWYIEFIEGQFNPSAPFDECGERSQYVADFGAILKVTNKSGGPVALQYSDADFKVMDNFGNRFSIMDFECYSSMFSNAIYHPSSYKYMMEDGEELTVGPAYSFGDTLPGAGGPGRGQIRLLGYQGEITNDTKFVILSVENFGKIDYAAWRFDVPR